MIRTTSDAGTIRSQLITEAGDLALYFRICQELAIMSKGAQDMVSEAVGNRQERPAR